MPARRFSRVRGTLGHLWDFRVKTTIAPRTEALRRALANCDDGWAADLVFLEAWEADPLPGPGAALRVAQIRRANPSLAAAIRRELNLQSRRGRDRAG